MCDGHIKGLLAPTLDAAVVALCADFERREVLLEEESLSARTEAELRYLNYLISEATAEIADARYVNMFIRDIGARVGYAYSLVEGMGEITYKMQKLRIKSNIARKLHLCD